VDDAKASRLGLTLRGSTLPASSTKKTEEERQHHGEDDA